MNAAAQSWLQTWAPAAHLTADSRRVQPGDIFLAYPGDENDGRDYIADAIQRGAAGVMFDDRDFPWPAHWALPHYALTDLKKHAGPLAATYYQRPSQGMQVFAVTGTNGKTTCASWLAQALNRLGQRTALIGTLGSGFVEHLNATGYTTPDAVLLQRELHELRMQGATALAIEASSIGLHQGRMNGLKIDVAIFTNLSRDHLDYHGTMAAYEAAKAQLFHWPGLRGASINSDDPAGRRLLTQLSGVPNVVSYSMQGCADAQLRVSDLQVQARGMRFQLHEGAQQLTIEAAWIGIYNVANWLACCGALRAMGVDLLDAVAALRDLMPPDGRLQTLGGTQEPLIVIDYAHTPDALEKVLQALQPMAQARAGELICVVGCGGQRDPGKRAPMAEVSARLATRCIFTSDNPRDEDPQAILNDMWVGVPATAQIRCEKLPDRHVAIHHAVMQASANDIVLLAGKGHERTQEIAGVKYPFYDRDEAQAALVERRALKVRSAAC